jgi:prepilin-type N-terminal cleavage/methylation domain-containing protein
MTKRGFTLIEVLVVVVVIAIIAILAFPSYKKANEVSKNEAARGKLLELSNAVRMYNEDARGSQRIAGDLAGNAFGEFQDPRRVFSGTHTDVTGAMVYLSRTGWNDDPQGCSSKNTSPCKYHFRNYTYYVCNPDVSSASQPDKTPCGEGRIVAMTGPDGDAEYGSHSWWVSNENLGVVGSDYGGN